MRTADLTVTEQKVVEAFAAGATLDLSGYEDPAVRGTVLRSLLLGGVAAESGSLPALWLTGAQVKGELAVEYADVPAAVELSECVFDSPVSFFGSRLRRLGLQDCTLPSLNVGNATCDATVRLTGCRISGEVGLTVAQINGSLLLDGAELGCINAITLRVSGDIVAGNGFTCHGLVRLTNAQVGGSVHLQGATLATPDGTALDCRHMTAQKLVLLPTRAPAGVVDLGHARIGVLRDDPATWPPTLDLDGLVYETLSGADRPADRLRWLRLDPHPYRPQAYTQLAHVYRSAGRDDDARTVLLVSERHRSAGLKWPGRWWGKVQDITIGYGYRPLRAAAWLLVLLLVGTTVFGQYPPRPAGPGRTPDFVPVVYTLDLVLPGVDFGQQNAFTPSGATAWLAHTMIIIGLLLVGTIAAAGARTLRRP